MKPIVPLLAGAAAAAVLSAAAFSQEPAFNAQEALVQARRTSFQFRAGRYELAPQSVAALEAAVKAAPSDARLWNALGTAYFQQVTASAHSGAFKDIPPLIG